MRIWLLQTGEPVPLASDVKRMRTALLAGALTARGHEVVWWASAFDHGSRRFVGKGGEVHAWEGGTIRLLPALGYRRNVSWRRYRDHRYVARAFARVAQDVPAPDAMVLALPDHQLSAAAAVLARAWGIPYLVDVRDPWPDSIIAAFPRGPIRWIVRMLLHKDVAQTRLTLRRADGIVAMMDGMLQWGCAHAGRTPGPADAVFYLGSADLPTPDPTLLAELRAWVGDARLVPVYVGTFGRQNHPGIVLEAAERLDADGETGVRFVVGGAGDEFPRLARRFADLPNVRFTGWLTPDAIAAVLAVGQVGLVPWAEGEAFPNKVFAYAAAGLPIVTSAQGELPALLREAGAGVSWPAGDPAALAGVLLELGRDASRVHRMGLHIRDLYANRLEAGAIYAAYARHVEHVVATAALTGP